MNLQEYMVVFTAMAMIFWMMGGAAKVPVIFWGSAGVMGICFAIFMVTVVVEGGRSKKEKGREVKSEEPDSVVHNDVVSIIISVTAAIWVAWLVAWMCGATTINPTDETVAVFFCAAASIAVSVILVLCGKEEEQEECRNQWGEDE
jgi:hypothetical protein